MKNLHKKIVCVALAGVIIGGFSASVIKVYAYSIEPLPPIIDLKERFNPELYPKEYPVLKIDSQYVYQVKDKRDVLPKGNNQGMEKVLRAIKGSGFQLIKCSGIQREIDEFVEDMEQEILKKSQVCFKSPEKFGEYLASLQNNPKPKKGVYRLMFWGFEGLFYFDPSRLLNMHDQPMIDLYSIQRGEKEYKYRLLDFNFNNEPILEKYKEPIEFYSVEQFFNRMHLDKRKRPGYFGNIKHGGVHEGGIYCVKIGDLIFLFRALA